MENQSINEELQVLNEMYFGKISGLLKLEEMFKKLKQEYSSSDPYSYSVYKTLNKDQMLQKIGKEIASIFGYKDVAVTFSHNKMLNAYTIPFVTDEQGNSYDLMERKVPYEKLVGAVKVSNSGFVFDTKKFPASLLVVLNLGCLFKSEISIPELVAILLHEIGHTFSLVIMTNKMTKRADEKFADQFAAMYGYGNELTTAFSKMTFNYSTFDKALKDVPIVNVVVGINQIMKGLATYYLTPEDPHPTYILRMKSIISQLEVDLKETPNLTPTMRKDIEKQIAFCKKAIEDTFNPSKDANISEKMTKYYYREMEPGFKTEQQRQAKAEVFSAPSTVNKKMKTMIHKKGWFK